ncbi:multiheme c-type cytochrome [Thermodesulfobacteriota bacterium]
MKPISIRKIVVLGMSAAMLVVCLWPYAWAQSGKEKAYVGSETCMECHEKEYLNFIAYAKKASSFEKVMKMKKGLIESEYRECLGCHTTGYGKPGGFVSASETPDLANPGCEVCHGPGSSHVESEDVKDIEAKLSEEQCVLCHNSDRVAAFNFKPMIYGGAH